MGDGNGKLKASDGNGKLKASDGNGKLKASDGNGKVERRQTPRPEPEAAAAAPAVKYDCNKCPAYCCSYDRIIVNKRDLSRLAKHFGVTPDVALRRFTKVVEGEQVLRHQKDEIYGSICMFLDLKSRRCTIYSARPGVCHEYPDRPTCGYYEFLRWERRHQENPEFIPLHK